LKPSTPNAIGAYQVVVDFDCLKIDNIGNGKQAIAFIKLGSYLISGSTREIQLRENLLSKFIIHKKATASTVYGSRCLEKVKGK